MTQQDVAPPKRHIQDATKPPLWAMVLKWVVVWVGMRAAGTSSRNAMPAAAAMVGPGEVGILLLGFGVTRWAIEPSVYFGILGYALLSIVLTPLVWHIQIILLARDLEAPDKPRVPIYQ